MAAFNHFYYDGDAPDHAPDDPRLLLGPGTDDILSAVADAAPGTACYEALCKRWTPGLVDALVRIGLFRVKSGAVYLDSPVMTQADAPVLNACFRPAVQEMTANLLARRADFRQIAARMNDGFSPETHLYHLVCGAVLDGRMFDALAERGLVATHRMHPSGRDYLIIAYESCEPLAHLSDRLLCSYNRLTDGRRALQSFGDADGDRLDAYRLGRLAEAERVPEKWREAGDRWAALAGPYALLDAAEALVQGRPCSTTEMALLDTFGYTACNRLAVPVYRREHQCLVSELAALTERCILVDLIRALSTPLPLMCIQHGVDRREVANETYHILFGQLNEALVDAGFAARPPRREGQGRYLQSVQLY